MHMRDKVIGYIGLAFLALFLLASAGLIIYTATIPVEYRVVIFDNIGSLKLQDPVTVRGDIIGEVCKVDWLNGRAVITIATKEPLEVHRNYQIAVADVGIMGDRLLAVDQGSADQPLVPKTDSLHGKFVLGPSEAIGMICSLRDAVIAFKTVSETLLKGDAAHPSLIHRYAQIASAIDSVSDRLLVLSKGIERISDTKLDSIYRVVDQTAKLSHDLAAEAPKYVQSITTLVKELQDLLTQVETLMKEAAPLIAFVKKPEDQEVVKLLNQLQKQIVELRTACAYLQDTGLKLMIWPF
jgi:ABC-type transporter Mla subunit MlaD